MIFTYLPKLKVTILHSRLLLLFLAIFLWQATKAQPLINSFSPVSGKPGTAVTISGANFNTLPSGNVVYFGGVKANVTVATATTITAIVPYGAVYAPLSVTVNGLTAYSPRSFTATFTPGDLNITLNSFDPDVKVPVMADSSNFITTAIYMKVADLDGDGKVDIIASCNYDSSLAIVRNTSTPGILSFAPYIHLRTSGIYNAEIATGDLDGDGRLDIVAGRNAVSTDTLTIFRNTGSPGNISFAPRMELTCGSSASAVIIRDIDRDGRPDICFRSSDSIIIFRNTTMSGNLSFADRIAVGTLGRGFHLAMGDLNNDGKADLAGTQEDGDSLLVFTNNSTSGNIIFAPPVSYPSFSSPAGLAIGDLDIDGKEDVAVLNTNSNKMTVFRNTASGNNLAFTTSNFTTYYKPGEAVLGDVNGDGLPEVFTSGYGYGITLLRNTSSAPGQINFAERLFFSESINLGARDLAVCDMDNDGKNDLVYIRLSPYAVIKRSRLSQPLFSTITPNRAAAGDTVTIKGVNFNTVTGVLLGGVPAVSFAVIDSVTIKAVVANASYINKKTTLLFPAGADSSGGFFYNGPHLISFSPHYAKAGDTITIAGEYINNPTVLTFGNTAAASSISEGFNLVRAVVDTGSSGKIFLRNAKGYDEIDSFLFFYAPVINSFAPADAFPGVSVTIRGRFFSEALQVKFGSIAATSFTVINDSTIIAVVGNGESGSITVATYGGTVSKAGFTYTVPAIYSFAPNNVTIGDTILIKGANFINVASVHFDTTAALSYAVVNDSTIKAVVGLGSSGVIKVETDHGVTTKSGFNFNGPQKKVFCPGNSAYSLYATVSDTITLTYQWQVYSNAGFVDLDNGENYAGVTTSDLQFINNPYAVRGNIYRCRVNGYNGWAYKIAFSNTFTGQVSQSWNNPANWSCNRVPDENTETRITQGTTVIVDVNTTIYNLEVLPGAHVTVNPGVTFTILH